MGRGGRTFTETGRRAQIVEAAIETIAELGYGRASYARIAERAELSSTGLISYHFASKEELIDEVVAAVVRAGQAFMLPRVEAAPGACAKLRAYIVSNLEFMAANRAYILAVIHVINALPAERDGQPAAYATLHGRGVVGLEAMLLEGQRSGEMRTFSTRVMAVTIRAAVDALAKQLPDDPDLDVDAYADELARLFDGATRAGDR